MFDPTVGSWMCEDPLGIDAGDPNFRRYVGNDPVNATDPSGLVVIENPKNDYDGTVFLDEVIAFAYQRDYTNNKEMQKLFPDATKSMAILLNLRDLAANPKKSEHVEVRVRYITESISGDDAPTQFAKHVASQWKAKPDVPGSIPSLNIFEGHGTELNGKPSVKSIEAVRDVFASELWPASKSEDPPLLSFSCCYGGIYNARILDRARNSLIPGSMEADTVITVERAWLHSGKMYAEVGRRIEIAETKKDKDKKLIVNLYFGEHGSRDEEKNKRYSERPPQYRFLQWSDKLKEQPDKK